ncbi:MAG: Omp28-related outer membrane protein [Bacteroidales bacterium]|nr:Omp28-related outer membrane protein [Bacteroidales bacterium]
MKNLLLAIVFVFSISQTASFAQFSVQKVLIEVFTGAWGGYGPDGFVVLESVLASDSNIYAVNIHVSDAMEPPEASGIESFYGPAYPQAVINRDDAPISRGSWLAYATNILSGASSADVIFDSVNFNLSTRELEIHMRTVFTGSVTGDLRMNVIIVEDSVTGSGTGYDQVNYDNNTAGHPYQGAGNPIVGMPHRYVARDYLGDEWGVSGIIPSSVSFGSVYTHVFNYTIPASYDYQKISLIGFVSYYGAGVSDREILNVARYPEIIPNSTVGITDNNLPQYTVYPNPSHGDLHIIAEERTNIVIVNSLLQEVYTGTLNEGPNDIHLSLPQGLYFANFSNENNSWMQKIVLK